MEEKRSSKRMNIDVSIQLKPIDGIHVDSKAYEVEVQNISRGGMAFYCKEPLMLNGFYDAHIVIWTKEKIDAVIQVVRKQDNNVYGCHFISMSTVDNAKIEIYELFNYPEEGR